MVEQEEPGPPVELPGVVVQWAVAGRADPWALSERVIHPMSCCQAW